MGESEVELVEDVVEVVVVVVVVVLLELLPGASMLAQPVMAPSVRDSAMIVVKLLLNLPDIDFSNQ
jgi:hypothetical protein